MRRRRSDLTVEFERLRDTLVEAIRDEKMSRVESCLDVYRVAVEAFLSKLSEYGAVYDFTSARREATSIEGGWPEIEWIKDDLRTVIDAAVKGQSDDVLRKIVFFPLSLAATALYEGDYYVFEQFLSWVGYAYRRGVAVLPEPRKSGLTEMIADFTREVASLHVEPQVRYATSAREIERYGEFCRGMVIVFSDLMKAGFDARDLMGFRLFVTTLGELFEGIRREDDSDDSEMLRWQLEHAAGEGERAEIEQRFEVAKATHQVAVTVGRAREEAFFGMGAWLIQKHLSVESGIPDAKAYYEVIPITKDVARLTEMFYRLWKQRTGERIFGWEWWVMAEAPRRQAVGVNFDYYLSRFYCIKQLEALAEMTTVESAPLPLNESITYLAGGEDGELRRSIKEIGTKRPQLEPVIGAKPFSAVDVLIQLLTDAVRRQREQEAEALVAAQVDERKVHAFVQNVVSEWRRNASVRLIISEYGKTRSGGEAPQGLGYYGFNILDRKDVYVADSKLYSGDWGKEYGRSIASTENEIVMNLIAGAVRQEPATRGKVVSQRLDDALQGFATSYRPNVIIFLNAWHVLSQLEQSTEFRRVEERGGFDRQTFVGHYRGIPMFRLYSRAERGRVLILDLARLGYWCQYDPRKVFDEERRVEVFNFYVKAYDESSAREAIQKSPKLAVDPDTGQRQDLGAAMKRLQQRVHLRILEQFEYRVDDSEAGCRITFAKER